MARTSHLLFAACLVLPGLWSVARAAEPFGFRGNGQGRFPDATPVTQWGPSTNVLWKTPLPKWSNASPALCGDRLFVCAEPTTLLCVNLADGKILWQNSNDYADVLSDPAQQAQARQDLQKQAEIQTRLTAKEKEADAADAESKTKPDDAGLQKRGADLRHDVEAIRKELSLVRYALPRVHAENGYSSATPVTDGAKVWAVFGTGAVACYDKEGGLLWRRIVEKPIHLPGSYGVQGTSASPVLAGDVLVVSYGNLYGLDAATGKELWMLQTPWSFATPVLAKIGGQYVLYTPGGTAVTVRDGKAVATGLGFAVEQDAAGPLLQDGVLYWFDEKQLAYKLPPIPAGQPEKLWENDRVTDPALKHIPHRYYATVLLHDGLLYNVTNESKVLTVLDAATGKLVYENTELGKRLGGLVYASPTLAGKYVVLMASTGNALVLEPGRQYKEIALNALEPLRSTPVFAGSRMYVRTLKALYCIGQ
jgi:outer membrane protein assembly factor BamB